MYVFAVNGNVQEYILYLSIMALPFLLDMSNNTCGGQVEMCGRGSFSPTVGDPGIELESLSG